MPLLTLQAPLPLHTYQTRQDTVTSDANGLISGIAAGSVLFTDLLNAGCYVLPAAPPTDTTGFAVDPVE